jgi:glycosyltransferase involved in cell wall biosynthesis
LYIQLFQAIAVYIGMRDQGLGSNQGNGANGQPSGANGHRSVSLAPAATAVVNDSDDSWVERRNPARRLRVSLIVPTLNEAENLPYVLPRIPEWVDEVLLVDGGSRDGTVEVARTLLPWITVLGQDRPGKGAALQAGFRAATGDIIVTLDADGSTDPAEIPAFVGCLLGGAEFVKGTRFAQGGGTSDMELVRRAGNWMLRSAVRVAFGGRYSDLCYGYNAFWRRLLPLLEGEADGFEIETLLNVRALAAGLKVVEVPSFESRRVNGLSNLNTWRDGCRVLRTIARERMYLRALRRGAPRRRLSNGSPLVEALAAVAASPPTDPTSPVGEGLGTVINGGS